MSSTYEMIRNKWLCLKIDRNTKPQNPMVYHHVPYQKAIDPMFRQQPDTLCLAPAKGLGRWMCAARWMPTTVRLSWGNGKEST